MGKPNITLSDTRWEYLVIVDYFTLGKVPKGHS
jgi:hypothetical protein